LQLVTFKKKAFLLKEGAVCNAVYFIESGIVRSYYSKEETEICSWFYLRKYPNILKDTLYRTFTKNPLIFWHWWAYFFDERYTLPYKSKEDIIEHWKTLPPKPNVDSIPN
jgi:hypothetical protein